MDRNTELNLLDELRGLLSEKTAFLQSEVTTNEVSHYSSAEAQ